MVVPIIVKLVLSFIVFSLLLQCSVVCFSNNSDTNLQTMNQSDTTNLNGNDNKGPPIFIDNLPIANICQIFQIPESNCSCENFPDFCPDTSPIFICNRYYAEIEGIVKIVASVSGVIGNSFVLIIAIIFRKEGGKFRQLITLLAFADLIFSIAEIVNAVPLFWTCEWIYGVFWCKFLKGLLNFGGIFALGIIVVIALERYLAIVKPFGRKKIELPFWAWPFAVGVLSLLSVIPMIVVLDIDEHNMCQESWPSSNGSLIYSIYLLVGTFLIPMGVLSCLYIFVIKQVRENASNLRLTIRNSEMLQQRNRTNKRVMVILFTIAIAFFILVFPNRIIWVILDSIGSNNLPENTYRALKYLAIFPYLFHVSVNPLIYSFIDKKFQGQFAHVFKGRKISFLKSSNTTSSNDQIALNSVKKPRSNTERSMLNSNNV